MSYYSGSIDGVIGAAADWLLEGGKNRVAARTTKFLHELRDKIEAAAPEKARVNKRALIQGLSRFFHESQGQLPIHKGSFVKSLLSSKDNRIEILDGVTVSTGRDGFPLYTGPIKINGDNFNLSFQQHNSRLTLFGFLAVTSEQGRSIEYQRVYDLSLDGGQHWTRIKRCFVLEGDKTEVIESVADDIFVRVLEPMAKKAKLNQPLIND